MRQIRRGVFETNSCSVHSITMCTKDEFDRFRNGEVWHIDGYWSLPNRFRDDRLEWITPDEARLALKDDEDFADRDPFAMTDEEVMAALDGCVESYETLGNEWYETYEDEYTTPGGETVVAFGYYGHD